MSFPGCHIVTFWVGKVSRAATKRERHLAVKQEHERVFQNVKLSIIMFSFKPEARITRSVHLSVAASLLCGENVCESQRSGSAGVRKRRRQVEAAAFVFGNTSLSKASAQPAAKYEHC